MGRKRSFLGFLATLVLVFLTSGAFAEGYTCDPYKRYVSCNANYFLDGTNTGNSCLACPTNSVTAADNTDTACTCKTGYSVGGSTTGATTTTSQPCSAIQTTITLNNKNATTNGTSEIYATYGTGVYLNSGRTNAMTTSTNKITIPSRRHLVTYNPNGGSVSRTTDNVVYTFKGYGSYIDANGYITSEGISQAQGYTANTAWQARWTPPTMPTFPTPTRTGFNFVGWGKAANATTGYVAGEMVPAPSADVVYYAIWKATGSEYSCPTFNRYDSCNVGYYMTVNGTYNGTPTVGNRCTVCPDSCDCAGGTAAPVCTVTMYFLANGGTGEPDPASPIVCMKDPTKGDCQAPVQGSLRKDDHVLLGWSTDHNAKMASVSLGSQNLTRKDETYYAVWSPCEQDIEPGTGVENVEYMGVDGYNSCKYKLQCKQGYYNELHGRIANDLTRIQSCSPCSEDYRDGPGTDSMYNCQGLQTKEGERTSCSAPANSYSHTCGTCDVGTCNQTVTYAGDIVKDCVAEGCQEPVESYTCAANYYDNGAGSCTQCGANSTTSAGNNATSCTCLMGHSVNGAQDGSKYTTAMACNPITYNITYKLNNGTNYNGAPTSYLYGKGATINGTPTRTGYAFIGWCTDPDLTSCNQTQTISTTDIGDKTFYAKWEANEYTITLDNQGATSSGTQSVKVTLNSTLPDITVPTKSDYKFGGYWSDKNCEGTQYYDVSGKGLKSWETAENGTLFACWDLDVVYCQAGKDANGTTCQAGYFCPGEKVSMDLKDDKTQGCMRECPGVTGRTISSPEGADRNTQCTASGTVDIYESTRTTVTGSGTETCNWNGASAYDASCNTVPTECIGGYYRPADNSPFCNPVGFGFYRGASENIRTQNSCSALNGANEDTTTEYNNSAEPTACYNTCSPVATADGNGMRNPINGTEFYNGKTIPVCSYTTKCNQGYFAQGEACEAQTFTVTLDHNGGASSTNAIYLKYADGWYSADDSKITSVEIPVLSGQTFGGYLSGNTVVVDSTGLIVASNKVFDSNATIKASWTNNPTIVCKAGNYYPGTGDTCAVCPLGSYCEGVQTVIGTGEAGRETCASLGGSFTVATNPNNELAPLVALVSAVSGSDSADDCYATNVAYIPNQYTTGSQTCYYDPSTKSYTAKCIDRVVYTCAGGYALATDDAIVCTEVGKGKYSPDKDKLAYKCPPNPGTETRGTTLGTTTASKAECILDNLWDTIGHAGVRKQCYWSEGLGKYDINCPQVIVVTCDPGYWYDTSQEDCVLVGDGAWSPAQSDCDGEPEQPTAPGCSTKRNTCPNGSLTGRDDASSVLHCIGVCPEGSYCVDGTEYSCATETNGEYPYSVAGSDDIGDCYKEATGCPCRDICTDSSVVKELYPNSSSCTNGLATTFDGVIYKSAPDVCIMLDSGLAEQCPVTMARCKNNYYFEGDLSEDWSCVPCSSVGDGSYTSSRSTLGIVPATSVNGINACYKVVPLNCTAPICPTAEAGASCTYDATETLGAGGWLYYGKDSAVPAVGKSDFVCPDAQWTCKVGYDKNESADIDPTDGSASDPSELCTPHVYTVTLDPNYADGTVVEIYQKYKTGWYSDETANDALSKAPVLERENWTFHGYATKASALESDYKLVVDANGEFITADAINATFTSDIKWYAQWTQNVYRCEPGKYYESNGADSVLKDCVAPYYCPGVGTVAVGATGCRSECPTPSVEPMERTATHEDGQTDVTSCYANFAKSPTSGEELANGDGTWVCQYQGTSEAGEYANCNVIVNACNAGYYNQSGTVVCTEADSGYYSEANDRLQTPCPQKTNYTIGTDVLRDEKADCYVVCTSYIPEIEHSTDVYVTAGEGYKKMFWSSSNNAYPVCQYTVECETGYKAISGATPQCKANVYEITLDKNGGAGDIADKVSCTFDSGECTLPATSVLKRAGYVSANKWCANPDGTGACYEAGKIVEGNISANGTDTKLYAIWTPAVFKIELSAPDADSNANQGPVYLKYATGWYSDANATQEMSALGTELPGYVGYVFAGYELNGVMIIDAKGLLSGSTNALIATTEDATATVKWTKGLTTCDAGWYYPGTGNSCEPCSKNHYCPGGSFATDSGRVDGLNPCPNGGLSAGGTTATGIGVCYKEKMAYATYIDANQTQARATGTWTCNYETIGYTNCHEDTIVIEWCAGGYWYDDAQTAIDCVVVGEDYWSAEAELTKHECPDAGNTNGATTSDALTDCQKRVDTYVSDSNHAKGSYVCSARLDGEVVKYDQNCQPSTIEITWCAGGYWYNEAETAVDCVLVGTNFYSAEGDIEKAPCPHDGTTVVHDAATPHGICQKTKGYPGIEYTGPAVNGSGVHGCLYDQAADGMMFGSDKSDGYVSCGKITMTKCDAGYWWQNGEGVCKEVEFGHFGPVADANNSNNPTGRQACPDNGLTQGTRSVDATECYLEKQTCHVANGTGEQTRFYDKPVVSDGAGYNVCMSNGQATDCETMCEITGCDSGFSLVDGACINCPEDHVCTPDEGQRSCAEATGGTHTKADAGTTDVAYCYAECALVQNAYQMTGRDYYGTNVADTCEIAVCASGYTLSEGKCIECPAGMVCDPDSDDGKPKSCASLTGGQYAESAPNSDSVNDCYKVCEPYEVVNGTAVPVSDKAYYPNECEYEGRSVNGNPCEIVDGVCIETSCNYNFEMDNGTCKPCAREHAISYKKEGNCVVESCANGYHPNGQQCEGDVIECSAPNAIAAKQTWDKNKNAFGACKITECADGYHLGANACQPDEQVCELEHGVGMREWNHKTNTWGECIATKCEPGYTNDPSLTNELWKQCGRCNNMYGANGELAVSSYVQGCEIAACMYQGELYTLENNECRLICDTYSDETGSRRWNGKKCEHTCKPGYTSW